MSEKQNQPNYLICPACQGSGCAKCRGAGLGKFSDGLFIYWGKKINNQEVLNDKVKLFVKNLINGLFLLFGLAGLLALIWKYAQSAGWQDFYGVKDWRLAFFWFSLLGDFYLLYRFDWELSYQINVQKKPFDSVEENIPHQDAWALSDKFTLEISRTFTPEALKAINGAWRLAGRFGHPAVEPLHLLASLLPFAKSATMFGRLGVDIKWLKEKINRALNSIKAENISPALTVDLKKVLLEAYLEAYNNQTSRVDLPELLTAMAAAGGRAADILFDLEMAADKIRNVAQWLRAQRIMRDNWQKFRRRVRLRPVGAMNRAMTATATPVLDSFGRDLTYLAQAGYLAPIINRPAEFEAIYRIMAGGERSVVLVGEDGAGKTAILEGLARKMAANEVPAILKDKRLISLSVAKLVGGVEPKQAGERLLKVIDEILRSGNIVLAVSDIQDIVGPGAGLDLSEVLASALAKKYFFCLATANPLNYRRYVENSALGRVLEKVAVPEMGTNQAIQVLEIKSGPVEYRNQVYFSYDAIAKIVELADRYLRERFLPEKAIGLLEEAAAYARRQRGIKTMVTAEDAAALVAEKTKIPIAKVTAGESEKLLNLEALIHERLIDQEPAVNMVAAALRRARAGLGDNRRPIVSCCFWVRLAWARPSCAGLWPKFILAAKSK